MHSKFREYLEPYTPLIHLHILPDQQILLFAIVWNTRETGDIYWLNDHVFMLEYHFNNYPDGHRLNGVWNLPHEFDLFLIKITIILRLHIWWKRYLFNRWNNLFEGFRFKLVYSVLSSLQCKIIEKTSNNTSRPTRLDLMTLQLVLFLLLTVKYNKTLNFNHNINHITHYRIILTLRLLVQNTSSIWIVFVVHEPPLQGIVCLMTIYFPSWQPYSIILQTHQQTI